MKSTFAFLGMVLCTFILTSVDVQVNGAFCENRNKPGGCPSPELVRGGSSTCTLDAQCQGIKKCCRTRHQGQKYCSDPVGSKSGLCPAGGATATTESRCYKDSDCKFDRKCCPDITDKCIATCAFPGPFSCYNIPKRGFCPEGFPRYDYLIFCMKDKDCPFNYVCCMDPQQGRKVCSEPHTTKAGFCPPFYELEDHNPSPDPNARCFLDSDCKGAMRKCCPQDTCHWLCVDAILF